MFDVAVYERHLQLSDAHKIIAQSIKYPKSVPAPVLQRARVLIEASLILNSQMRETPRKVEA